MVERDVLTRHLQETRFASGDRERALADAHAIAEMLRRDYGAVCRGIGSLFDRSRAFRQDSDIDLVVERLPAARFFEASARAARLTDFDLDLIPAESATPAIRAEALRLDETL